MSHTAGATVVTFEDLDRTRELPLGKPVDVEIPTTEAPTLRFTCGRGMYAIHRHPREIHAGRRADGLIDGPGEPTRNTLRQAT